MKDRREVLAAFGLPLPVPEETCERPARGPAAGRFPNHAVITHEGSRALFNDDLLVGKTVVLHCMSLRTEPAFRTAEKLARVQPLLAGRLGRDVFFYSLSVDPEHDTVAGLRDFAARHGAGPGWLFLTGEATVVQDLRSRMFPPMPGHAHGHGAAPAEDCSMAMFRYGNAGVGLWGAVPAVADPEWIAQRLSWVQPGEQPAGPPRRRGPLPLRPGREGAR